MDSALTFEFRPISNDVEKCDFLKKFGLRSHEDNGLPVTSNTNTPYINLSKMLEEPFKYVANKKKTAVKRNKKAKRCVIKKTVANTVCNEKLLLQLMQKTPFSITSEYGLKLCHQFGTIGQNEIKVLRERAENYCGLKKHENVPQQKKNKKLGTVLKLKKKKPEDPSIIPNTHKYSFTKRDRVKREAEIIVGVAASSFKYLNKCRKLSVTVKKMTPAVIMKHQHKWKFLSYINKCPVRNIFRPKVILQKVETPMKAKKSSVSKNVKKGTPSLCLRKRQ